jgi:hypothetical protein
MLRRARMWVCVKVGLLTVEIVERELIYSVHACVRIKPVYPCRNVSHLPRFIGTLAPKRTWWQNSRWSTRTASRLWGIRRLETFMVPVPGDCIACQRPVCPRLLPAIW